MEQLGFVGLGAMGTPMACRLATVGYSLTVFDLIEERTLPLVQLGAQSAGSVTEVAESSDTLILMVVNAEQAEDILFGQDGAARSMKPGAVVIIMSTVGPESVQGLSSRLNERGLSLLDAPVSGGVTRAEKGELLIMVGGSHDLFEESYSLLKTLGSTIVHCGDSVGEGQSVKLVNQLLCGIHIAAAGEALAYAAALGLDPRSVHEVIRHGAANSFMLEDRGERMLNYQFNPAKSALDIFVKDMNLVRRAAEERGTWAPLAEAAYQVYLTGSSLGFGAEDDSGIVRVFEHEMGS